VPVSSLHLVAACGAVAAGTPEHLPGTSSGPSSAQRGAGTRQVASSSGRAFNYLDGRDDAGGLRHVGACSAEEDRG
jgi:hypothetical protein